MIVELNDHGGCGDVAKWSKALNSGPMVVSSKRRSDISVELTSQC